MTTSEKVLNELLNVDGEISGEFLSQKLGITRAAVWKAIEKLRKEGYDIDATPKRGYRLIPGQDALNPDEIRRLRSAGQIGGQIEFHKAIDSTNKRAKLLAAEGAQHGYTVLADSQSAGRGRFDRAFFSPEHSGIYISFILRPKLTAERSVLLTAMAALAVAQAIEMTAKIQCDIKWVNDVYINGKKVCGILCEAGLDFESGCMDYVVVGIGVNVKARQFPKELSEIATSVENECGHLIDRNKLTSVLMDRLNDLYAMLENGSFMEEYRRRSNVIGREVFVLRGDDRYTAKVLDIDKDGSLVVETEDGLINRLYSGEISLRFR